MTPDTIDTAAARLPAGLLVVTVDGLPAWMLPAFGATWVATPAIDALAARGIVFDRAIATALEPGESLRDLAGASEPDGLTLVRAAVARGWKPALVTDDPTVAASLAGELAAEVTLVAAAPHRREAADDGETELARLAAAAIEVLGSGRHELVWCHVASLRVAWDAPRRYRDRYVDPEDPPPPDGAGVPSLAVTSDTDPDLVVGFRQVFAGQLSLLDAEIGRLFAAVMPGGKAAAAGAWSVLFAGARGMPLGLHGWMGVGGPDTPHGELVHVPAILVDAAGRMAAQRYGGLVVPADLGCTLAELIAGGAEIQAAPDPSNPWRGRSLAGLFAGWSEAAARDRVVVGGAESMAIITPAWHCLWHRGSPGDVGRVELFAKPDDFFEANDVADRCRAVVEPLADLFAAVPAGDRRGIWRAALPEARPG
jgi:arylsulfatase A-like enzyme